MTGSYVDDAEVSSVEARARELAAEHGLSAWIEVGPRSITISFSLDSLASPSSAIGRA